jgi:hypothetical protein
MDTDPKFRDPMAIAGDLVRLKGRHHNLQAEACHCIQRLMAERDMWRNAAMGLADSVERIKESGPLVADDMLPILDVLPRLWKQGFKTRPEMTRWVLVSRDGVTVCTGQTFRDLCVNVLLGGF